MLKRQDSLLSSSRRETPTPPPSQLHHHAAAAAATSVGCMSGIFHLISKYQKKNKRLTSGRKHGKSGGGNCSSPKRAKVSRTTQTSPSAKISDTPKKQEHFIDQGILENTTLSSSSCGVVPRSPTLRPEIRRSNTPDGAKFNRNNKPTLVAKLMGLEEIKVPSAGNFAVEKVLHAHQVVVEEQAEEGSAGEKRRRLLQALEKCNDDLEALKEAIKAVQSVDKRIVDSGEKGGGDTTPTLETSTKKRSCDGKQLSPASVLDQSFCSSPLSSKSKTSTPGLETPPPPRKHRIESGGTGTTFFREAKVVESWRPARRRCSETSPQPPWKRRSSKAMMESVEEVCGDIAWGERREVGRLGLMVQDSIWRDLVEELVKDMLAAGHGCFNVYYVLPFQACRRRLYF